MSDLPELKKKFGFGFMRLPTLGEDIDLPQLSRMVDEFLDAGFNYFDTAHGYMGGRSETALRAALTSRYPRERYVLTTKLSGTFFRRREDILPLFESQLRDCGVDYFDFYLMHAQSADNYERYKACGAYELAAQLKAQGRVRHVGLSFHDSAAFLDHILTEQPQMEVVQLQFNYADYEDPVVQSRQCWEVCRRHGKPVIVMEPVKGGRLAGDLPPKAKEALAPLGGSPAGYALRYAAGFEGVRMVLSGMSDLAQLRENVKVMGDLRPLDETERAAVARAAQAVREASLVGCTGCGYCLDGCPRGIPIPGLFAGLNAKILGRDPEAGSPAGARALECVKCGKCEEICPQHLPVRRLLGRAERALR